MEPNDILEQARTIIRAEGELLLTIADQLDDSFVQTVRLVSECSGKILITGAGTSGTMARRLAHLLATCGMAAFYLHPGEALHGPSAAVRPGDLVIAFSKAGKSAELNKFVEVARQREARIISWTWQPESPLGQLSDVVIPLPPDEQAEGEGVLPFGSSLANGAIGDALCLAAKRLRGFDLAELTQTHPSGATAELVRH